MAEKTIKEINLSSDNDIEPDGEAVVKKPLFETFSKMKTDTSAVKGSTSGPNELQGKVQTERKSEQLDSGILSMKSGSLELKSSTTELVTSQYVEKSPVQCSDVYNDAYNNELEKRLGKLCVSEDVEDEGHCSMSITSLESAKSESSTTQQPNQDVIEIDLFEQDDDGDTLLHVAIVTLCTETAIALIGLAEEVDCLNIQNCLHQSPLHLAILTGQVQVVKALIAKGVDVALRDKQGNTPLHIACRKGDRDSVQMIVQSFGDNLKERLKYFSLKNCEGLPCQHVAALQKEYIILGHLFAKGADVNLGDARSGRTLLHSAVERNDIETVTLLLTHKEIDIDRKTFKGETPLFLAYWRNYQDILKRLIAKGAYFSYDNVEDSDDEES